MPTETGPSSSPDRIDTICTTLCALIPIGVVMGTVVFEFFVCLTGVLWLGKCAVKRTNPLAGLKPISGFKIDWWFFAFMCFNLSIYISVAANGPGDKGVLNDLSFLRFFILAAAMVDISSRMRIEKYLILGLAAAVVVGALNSIAAHALGVDLVGKSVTRYAAKGAEAKRIAGLCTYAGAFFFGWSLFDRQMSFKHRAVPMLLVAVCIPLVLKTGIRTLIISGAAGLMWVLFLYIQRRISKIIAALIVVAAIGSSIYVVTSGNLYLQSFWDRIHIWKVNYAMWQTNPLAGVGPFAYRSQYREAMANAKPGQFAFKAPDGKIYDHPEITFHAHSLFMMLLTSTGIIGVTAFLWLLYQSWRTIHRYGDGWREGLLAWPVVLLFVGISGYNIYDPWYHSIFVFFLILIAVSRKEPLLVSKQLFELNAKKGIAEAGH